MAEIAPADQDNGAIAKERTDKKVLNTSTQANPKREYGFVGTTFESPPTGTDGELQLTDEPVCPRSPSPVTSLMSMQSDRSAEHPVSFARVMRDGEVPCTVCFKKACKSCLTCMDSFCEKHVKQHFRAPAFHKHKLVEATANLEQKVCLLHHRELELFCQTDQTPICVLCVPVEHYGHRITALENNENQRPNKTQMASQRDQQNFFLEKLGLLEFYPNKLTLKSLLLISSESILGKEVRSLKDVPLTFLRNLLMANAKCWHLTSFNPEKAQNSDDSDNDSEDDDDKLNPLDLVTALYLCADSFLQQEISMKMSMCQFAVPFLLPENNQCKLMLWALRNICKEWRSHSLSDTKSCVVDSVVHAQIPLISFVRLNNCTLSKSQVLNHILSDAQQSNFLFIHRDMSGGNVLKKISNGLVEIAWCLPCGQSNIDVFPEAVAIANMRGDISSNKTQFSFLMEVSTAIFVFLDTMTQEEKKLLNSYDPHKSKLFLVINSQDKKRYYINSLNLQENHVVRRKPQLNLAESSSLILGAINLALRGWDGGRSMKMMSDTASKLGISLDENKASTFARNSAYKIIQGIGDRTIADYKNLELPLQGKYLKDMAWIELEECRLQHAGHRNLEEYKTYLQNEKCDLRQQQGAIQTSQAMGQFIQSLSTKDIEERAFFLRWMALKLDRSSRKHLTDIRLRFKQVYRDKDNKSIKELDQQLLANSLGIEHYIREMGQMYESKQSEDTRHLPSIAAELLLDGYPIELLDGDTSTIPVKWVTDLLMELHKKVKRTRLLVVSVLGVQSTGKSTLLNTMFGVQFPVSSGRCTRGAYMLFLSVEEELKEKLKCDFVLLIDTEGLKSAELADLETSHQHDNQLATLVIGLSDVTIINIAMENATDMKDILQIAVHAFLRMTELGKKPICHFVHQNVSGVSAHDNLMAERKHLLDELNEMTHIAAVMEKHSEIINLTDILDYDVEKNNWYIPGLWNGTPPMAAVNSGYSQSVHKFKQSLFESIKTTFPKYLSEIPDFLKWMSSLWTAVKHENFIFSFRNTLVAYAYDCLCKEFLDWEWSFRKCIYNWMNNADTQIYNTETSRVHKLSQDLELNAIKTIEQETAEMNEQLSAYYKQRDRYAHLVERYKTEFQININCLQKEMTEYVKDKLQSSVSLKVNMERVETLQKEHSKVIEEEVLKLLKSFQGMRTELSDSDLKEQFQKMWRNVTIGICTLNAKDISSCVMKQLRDNLSQRGQKNLSEIPNLSTCGLRGFKVKSEYISIWKDKVVTIFKNFFSLESDVQNVANNLIESCVRYIKDVVGTKTDYQDMLTKEILYKIDTGLKKIEKKTTTTFEVDLKVHICGIAARSFLKMHQNFLLDKNPQKHLERSRELYLRDFIDSYRKNDLCLRKAQAFTQLCIKPAVTEYIQKSLGIEIVDEILASSYSSNYSSRSYFQYTILSELLERDDFEKFVRYILNYENFVKDWIDDQVVDLLSKDMALVKLKGQLLKTVIEKITKATKEVQGEINDANDTNGATMFVEKLCHHLRNEISLPSSSVKEVLFQLSGKITPFVDHFLQSLDTLRAQLCKEFGESTDINDTLMSLTVKPQNVMFERVFGCGELCPFCKIPCEAGGKDHTQHHATVHRPQGLGGCMYADTDKLFQVLCTTCVYSDTSFQNHATNHKIHPYKHYRKYYPNWIIAPDPSIQASDYWKYVMVRYNEKFAKKYYAKPADCPQKWHSITKEQALEGLKSAFNIK